MGLITRTQYLILVSAHAIYLAAGPFDVITTIIVCSEIESSVELLVKTEG